MIMKKIVYVFAIIVFLLVACEKDDETGISVSGITLNQETQTLEVGDTVSLFGTISPQEATNKTIYWSSSAGGVATVSDGGLVIAVSEGFAMIKAQTEDGGFDAYCSINVVTESINVTGSSIDITGDTLDINCTLQLKATVSPENATDKGVDWSTSDATIATVSADGLVTGVGGGIATITATTNDGNFTVNCEVFVYGKGTITAVMEKGFLNTPGNNVGVDLAVDASGVPYLALNKYDASLARETKASCEVWKYSTGTSWNQFGSLVAITDDEAFAPGLIIGEAGTVYVSHKYFDDEHDPKYDANVVAYSSGGDWTYLGSGNSSLIKNGNTKLNEGSDLAVKEDGTLLIASYFYGDGYVHYWSGSEWISYNGYKTDAVSFWAGGIEIECFGNKPLVSVRTGSGTGKTGVLYGNETNGVSGEWEWLGGSYANSSSEDCKFQTYNTSAASLALNSKGDVYTAYLKYGSENVVVKKIEASGSSWSTIYTEEYSNAELVDVVVTNDYVYLLVAEYNDGISIYRLTDCGEWVSEGKTSKLDTYYNFDAIAGKKGEIYIGYECTDNSVGQVGVFKYTPYIRK
jgi:transglutaminase/protease-like cytokinesis protein 3